MKNANMENNSEDEFKDFIKEQLFEIVNNNMVLYKYIGFETGKLAIQHSTVGFTNPLSFNDPFDCTLNLVDFENVPDWYRKSLIDTYYPKLTPLAKENMLTKMSSTPDAVAIKLLQTKGMDNEIKNRGVSCFSKNFDNMLMWSHYADSHKGVCIGFNLLPLYLSIEGYTTEKMVIPVDYKNEFTPMNYYQHKIESIVRWLKTKSKVWSYEEEVRVIMNHLDFRGTDKFIAEIDPSSFASVYLGTRMPAENQAEISQLVRENYPHVTVYKIVPAIDSFELKAIPHV